MSTTEHTPTLEQKLDLIVKDYKHYQNVCNHTLVLENIHHLPYGKNMDAFVALAAADQDNDLDAASVFEYHQLSSNNRIKLSRSCDGYSLFRFVHYPGDEPESVSLCIGIDIPIDPTQRQDWINQRLRDDLSEPSTPVKPIIKPLPSKEPKYERVYRPVYTMYPTNNVTDFGFGYVWSDYRYDTSLVIKYKKTKMPHHFIGLQGFILNQTKRSHFRKFQQQYFRGYDQIDLAPSKEEVALAAMKQCPQCQQPPIRVCDCTNRDSMCQQGHHWYYCPDEQMVKTGLIDH